MYATISLIERSNTSLCVCCWQLNPLFFCFVFGLKQQIHILSQAQGLTVWNWDVSRVMLPLKGLGRVWSILSCSSGIASSPWCFLTWRCVALPLCALSHRLLPVCICLSLCLFSSLSLQMICSSPYLFNSRMGPYLEVGSLQMKLVKMMSYWSRVGQHYWCPY